MRLEVLNVGKRTTIKLDCVSERLVENENINLSKEVREYIKDKYGKVESLEKRRDVLEAKKRKMVEKKAMINKRKNEIEDKLRRINEAITTNKVYRKLESNKEIKQKVMKKVKILKMSKKRDGEKMWKKHLEKNVDVLINKENLPFERKELRKLLKTMVEV